MFQKKWISTSVVNRAMNAITAAAQKEPQKKNVKPAAVEEMRGIYLSVPSRESSRVKEKNVGGGETKVS